MRRFASVSPLLVTLAIAASVAVAKKPRATKPAKSKAASGAPAPVAAPVDRLASLASSFQKGGPLESAEATRLANGVEGLSSGCGPGCTPVFTALKVQNRTPGYLAVLLRRDVASKAQTGNSTWLLTFGPDGHRIDARRIEARESAEGNQSGVRSEFLAPDRLEVRSWSSFEPASKEAAVSETLPERLRIAADGRIVEEAARK